MRSLATIAIAVALAMPGMIARADAPRECAVVPGPSAADLAPYRKSALWGAGLRAYEAGQMVRARRALQAAWDKLRRELAQAFATDRCDEDRIARTLGRRVFSAPPDAIPGEDRFVPPRPVALVLARARCQTGATGQAGMGLLDESGGSDLPARVAAAVLLAGAGHGALAVALVPQDSPDPRWEAVRQYHAALRDDAGDDAPNRAADALARLVQMAEQEAR